MLQSKLSLFTRAARFLLRESWQCPIREMMKMSWLLISANLAQNCLAEERAESKIRLRGQKVTFHLFIKLKAKRSEEQGT